MNLQPLGDRLIVEVLEEESTTASGIVLPDNAKEKPKEGRIVAVGEGRMLKTGERSAPQVKQGDRVIFSSYAGTEIKVMGDEYLVLGEDDILAIVD